MEGVKKKTCKTTDVLRLGPEPTCNRLRLCAHVCPISKVGAWDLKIHWLFGAYVHCPIWVWKRADSSPQKKKNSEPLLTNAQQQVYWRSSLGTWSHRKATMTVVNSLLLAGICFFALTGLEPGQSIINPKLETNRPFSGSSHHSAWGREERLLWFAQKWHRLCKIHCLPRGHWRRADQDKYLASGSSDQTPLQHTFIKKSGRNITHMFETFGTTSRYQPVAA